MALPLSGPLSMSMINTELGRALNQINSQLAGSSTPTAGTLFWLGNQSGSIDQNPPHAISEWYGYTGVVTLSFDASTQADTTNITTGGFAFSHTPVRDPRGVLVYAINYANVTERVNSVTYGGRPLTRVAGASDTGTEAFNNTLWFLGTGIPTGVQDVSITFSGGTNNGDAHWLVASTLYNNATYDVEVQSSGAVSNDAVNPAITGGLSYGGFNCLSFVGIGSGLAATSSLTLLNQMTPVEDADLGNLVTRVDRQVSASSVSSFVIGYTASLDDVALVAAAFKAVVQSPSPSRTPTVSITSTVSLTPSVTLTISRTPSISITPSISPTRTVSISVTPSITRTISLTPSISVTPSVSITLTPSITRTPSITPSVSLTRSISVTPSVSITRTPSITVTPPPPSLTPSITRTPSISVSTPAPSFFTYILGTDPLDPIVACAQTTTGTFYSATSTFSSGMLLWTDTALTKGSPASYYSDGVNYGRKTSTTGTLGGFTVC